MGEENGRSGREAALVRRDKEGYDGEWGGSEGWRRVTTQAEQRGKEQAEGVQD